MTRDVKVDCNAPKEKDQADGSCRKSTSVGRVIAAIDAVAAKRNFNVRLYS